MEKRLTKRCHQDVLAEIAPETRAALQQRHDLPGVLHLLAHGTLILACSIWIAFALPLWQVVLVPQGILLVFLFTLQHECTHETPFSSKRFCYVIGVSCGSILIQPFTWFRYFHLAHHRHTNDPARDPELLSGAKPQTWRQMIWHVSGVPLWVAMIRNTVQCAVFKDFECYTPARAVPRMRREARFMITLFIAVIASLFATSIMFWVWVLPLLIGQPFLRLYLLAEHGRCPPVANMLENTRTTFTNRIVRFLAWNMPYHIEHHSAPNVPFHNLPQLHQIMRDDLITTAESYTSFTTDYVAQLNSDG